MYDGEVIFYPFLPPFISSTLKVDPSFYDKGECLFTLPRRPTAGTLAKDEARRIAASFAALHKSRIVFVALASRRRKRATGATTPDGPVRFGSLQRRRSLRGNCRLNAHKSVAYRSEICEVAGATTQSNYGSAAKLALPRIFESPFPCLRRLLYHFR
jgi:hypothetical protein